MPSAWLQLLPASGHGYVLRTPLPGSFGPGHYHPDAAPAQVHWARRFAGLEPGWETRTASD